MLLHVRKVDIDLLNSRVILNEFISHLSHESSIFKCFQL